jgi:hypothetical protein
MNNGRVSNGFILGLIVGGGIVFLFGTKTGKALLKKFSEEGLEGIAEILEDVDLRDDMEEADFEETESASNHKSTNGELKTESPEEVKEELKKPTKKRFFRKIRK